MTTGERIRKRRKQLGVSAEQIAVELGVSAATIYRYEKGDIEKLPGNILEPLSNILRTTPAYLMGWSNEPEAPTSTVFDIPNITPIPKIKMVPLITNITCNDSILAEQNAESYVYIEDIVEADFAIRAKNDNMIRVRIFEGDLVFVHQQSYVDNGDLAAVQIGPDSKPDIKRVCKIGNSLQLRDENTKYETMIFEGETLSDIRILGKVIGFLSTNI